MKTHIDDDPPPFEPERCPKQSLYDEDYSHSPRNSGDPDYPDDRDYPKESDDSDYPEDPDYLDDDYDDNDDNGDNGGDDEDYGDYR